MRAITVQGDVSKHADIVKLFESTIEELGHIDIVFSNSGIEHWGTPDQVDEAQIDKIFDVNFKAQFFVAQQAYKYMSDYGRLILMSSVSGQMVRATYDLSLVGFFFDYLVTQGVPAHSIYAASKAAVQGMVRCLAYDFGPKNITVNCVAPGGIKTDMYGTFRRRCGISLPLNDMILIIS